ncbi:MAG: type II toxin-antitoxin system prevent-host-death family antitoxin [Caulobacteraceae bacterium]|nr:type II toxin-antitoxin system prevent-host-death family antitoxin [Caulobacteraceae bacterium]
MIANIHHAKTHLSALIERAEAGEDVIIDRAGRPVARLTPIGPAESEPRGAWMGSLSGVAELGAGWDDPEEELSATMETGAIYPSEVEE